MPHLKILSTVIEILHLILSGVFVPVHFYLK